MAGFLCKWQLDRRAWKTEMLAEREARLAAPPVDLFSARDLPPEYTRVALTGRFDHAKSAFVGPRGRPGEGVTEQCYLVITPLTSLDGSKTALVNRGWAPLAWKADPQARKPHEPTGTVRVMERRWAPPCMYFF